MLRPKTNSKKIIFYLLGMLSLTTSFAHAQDVAGGKDHPLLTRMPEYYVEDYETKDFNQYEFATKTATIPVEGQYYKISYLLKGGATQPSELQIVKNYTAAIKKIGGTVIYEDNDRATLKYASGGKETWVDVYTHSSGEGYRLTIIEKGELVQEVTASAAVMSKDILATGHVAVYGIYFDFNKTDLKPESTPTLKEIVKLLEKNQALKLYIVGHTDNVGDFAYNMKLSQARAEAVVKELVTAYGVSASRLKADGAGPLCPVESNKTEEGRAKNRRVELVEQ